MGAVTVVHGECDSGNSNYESDLVQLFTDYDADIKAITGQTDTVQMLVSQQNSVGGNSTLAQWLVGANNPDITRLTVNAVLIQASEMSRFWIR